MTPCCINTAVTSTGENAALSLNRLSGCSSLMRAGSSSHKVSSENSLLLSLFVSEMFHGNVLRMIPAMKMEGMGTMLLLVFVNYKTTESQENVDYKVMTR